MGDLTKDFSRHEFACRGNSCCGHSAPISPILVAALQLLRDHLSIIRGADTPILIVSGFRCLTHDRALAQKRGASPVAIAARNSQHCLGLAADIRVDVLDPSTVVQEAEKILPFRSGGIGRYTGTRARSIHLDCRTTGPARWRD